MAGIASMSFPKPGIVTTGGPPAAGILIIEFELSPKSPPSQLIWPGMQKLGSA